MRTVSNNHRLRASDSATAVIDRKSPYDDDILPCFDCPAVAALRGRPVSRFGNGSLRRVCCGRFSSVQCEKK